MKKIILSLSSISLISGCTPHLKDWSQDCEAHYSVTGREKSNCLKRIENQEPRYIPAEKIVIDPDNTDRPTFEEVQKNS